MGNFTARLELPKFIPKEEIMRKRVFDSELLCLGRVQDWTYTPDGEIKMVVKRKEKDDTLTTLVPFSHIEKVGDTVLLKTRSDIYEFMKQQEAAEEENDEMKPKDEKPTHLHKILNEIAPELLSQFSQG
jgi:sporulation protein YlmC with PRC-barrel domain